MAQTEAQKRATAKWRAKNKEKQARYVNKSKAIAFIKNDINLEEIELFLALMQERKLFLEKSKKDLDDI